MRDHLYDIEREHIFDPRSSTAKTCWVTVGTIKAHTLADALVELKTRITENKRDQYNSEEGSYRLVCTEDIKVVHYETTVTRTPVTTLYATKSARAEAKAARS